MQLEEVTSLTPINVLASEFYHATDEDVKSKLVGLALQHDSEELRTFTQCYSQGWGTSYGAAGEFARVLSKVLFQLSV